MSGKQQSTKQSEGIVRAILGSGKYHVELASGHCINASASAKIKVRLTSILVGDIVRCEISPVEPGRARIVGHV